jgi:opacity protein-like surface antigen
VAHVFNTTVLVTALAAAPAAAQSTGHGFVRALGGVTFVTETSWIAGAGVGVNVHARAQIVGEAGHIANTLSKDLQEDLDRTAAGYGNVFGAPLTLDAQAETFYGFGGLRVTGDPSRRVMPFVEGGAGVAHVQGDIHASAGGMDLSARLTFDIPAAETHPLATVGGGIAVALHRRIGLDVGYRYIRIWVDDDNFGDPRFNVSVAYAGLRWLF